ncbi:DUF4235 domain-containing protein [Streptomyces pactum]|uniref:DUF4235 domain-containing protein n=1 Tax=Streptomyces pactum TaxID=68249 RepID=A0ABS0NSX5_9ACTN|nr:DUF4235 domain-containing protein [Streptomyces pactum]MBH5338162.1 DUF4235 domain-containing protein [Streptomyces pactum]
MGKVGKLVYKVLSLLFGVLGGVIAGAVFKQVWKMAGHEGDAPKATDEERTWREVLPASALQGAIFALVKAVVNRGGAAGFRRLTGTWPG